jgi:hypothetical protein
MKETDRVTIRFSGLAFRIIMLSKKGRLMTE